MTSAYESNHGAPRSGTAAKLVVAWLLVAVPSIWGVAQTVNKSLPLFTSPSAQTAPAASPATPR